MDNEADVLFVDTHAKGCGCDDDVVAWDAGYPFILAVGPFGDVESGMVSCCANVVFTKARRKRVTVGSEGDIDDARDSVWAFGVIYVLLCDFLRPCWIISTAGIDRLQP